MSTADKAGRFVEDLAVGQSESYTKTVTQADIVKFAEVSGDTNPIHLDAAYAATTPFKGCIAHGMLSVGFISAVLGTKLPGPGAIYLGQSLKFKAPVKPGDTVVAGAALSGMVWRKVTMTTTCQVGDTVVIEGEAVLLVPSRAG